MSWTAEEIQAKLRRIFSHSSLTVKVDRAWAHAHGVHPDALQVWDTGPVTGKPYVVAVLARNGVPCDPSEAFWLELWRSHAAQRHQGRAGWADEQERAAIEYDRKFEERNFGRMEQRFKEAEEPIMHMLGEGRVYSLNPTSNRRMRRTRAGVLVPA